MNIDMLHDPEMMEIFDGFIVESYEILEKLSQDLMMLEENHDDVELLNKIFRAYHTIKGNSSFIGLDDIAGLTHKAEDLLNKMRKQELEVNPDIIDVLFEVQDHIEKYLDVLKDGEVPEMDFSITINKLKLLRSSETSGNADEFDEDDFSAEGLSGPEESEAIAENSPADSANFNLQKALSSTSIFEGEGDFSDEEMDLINAAFSEINKSMNGISANTQHIIEQAIANEINEELPIPTNITNGALKNGNKVETAAQDKNPKSNLKAMSSETIRIDLNRIDDLMDLCGELVLGRNRLSQITRQFSNSSGVDVNLRDLMETTEQIDFITSEVQASVMRMRMVPISKLFQKAPRIVRDIAKTFNKKINLQLNGEDTEIDRGIIEELTDPLVHMIRNACDHGIESPEERIARGKPEIGTIILDAEQEGNNIVISISDDGKGLDPEKLKQKAVNKKLITLEQSKQMSLREVYQLIFTPGFSMAEQISNVSGRGVGMDVVKTNIQNLKGIIEVESEIGRGSKFILKLPLTLASILGLLVRSGKETVAIPLSSVVEVVALDEDKINFVNQQEVMKIRDEIFPLVRLEKRLEFFDLRKNDVETKKYVVIVGLGIKRVGIIVDELMGQQEIVIKSLGEYLGTVSGIAGSTILGDGRVIIIIDINELLND